MFADDCVLIIYNMGNKWNVIYERIHNYLDRFVDWCIVDKLTLNAKKTQAMIVGTCNRLAK